MKLQEDFVFRPLPPVKDTIHFPFKDIPNPLGPLADLVGTWAGTGFNVIWRPFNGLPAQDRFLELNRTVESNAFTIISGPIPNRGLLQPDINMFGLTYLQQVSDANLVAGLHIEPGIWAVVPPTTNPPLQQSVVRMASIPHGTTVMAQGFASEPAPGPPAIPVANILPFAIGNPNQTFHFPEQNLATPTPFRSPPAQLVGITQAMIDNPNSVLQTALTGQTVLSTTTLRIQTIATAPVTGGGTDNTTFLTGAAGGPNALAVEMDATFWIETLAHNGLPPYLPQLQLQYTQRVLLNFNGLSWPHISVGTLRKHVPETAPIWKIDPDIPKQLLEGDATLRIDPAVGAPVRSECPFHKK